VITTPAPAPGFAGPGHVAIEVLSPSALAASDPFVLLMDDRLEFEDGQRIGGAHPHAGLETVTLVLDGAVRDRDEGLLAEGDAVWMTAGRGIVHNEDVEATGPVRILQLWVMLPRALRNTEPHYERIPRGSLPVRRTNGVEARLYSGTTGELRSPTRNHVPVTVVDVRLGANADFEQELPASYNGFLYVLEGSLRAGPEGQIVSAGQVAWLDRAAGDTVTTLSVAAESSGARFVLYAGERQNEPLMQRGPFVAGSEREILEFHRAYQAGRFVHLSHLARAAADTHPSRHDQGQ
jgi:quercetin 2,3-dioxygenase